MTTRGIVVIARNNSQVDYVKQARFLAKRAKDILGLPTTLVTDSIDFLDVEYPDWQTVFDKVISIVWKEKDIADNTVLSRGEKHSHKKFYDGTLVSKRLEWKNEARTIAYDVSPYDETLVLDSDIVISNDIFLKCFEQQHDLLLYKTAMELLDIDRQDDFRRISDTSVDFYWATCVFFRKTRKNKVFFDLIKHIQENWNHYKNIFQINSPYYRNDYAFSIAIHIMNGYQSGDFAKPMPGTLYFITDKSILWQIQERSLLILLEKPTYDGEYTPVRIESVNLHCINKFSLNRCIDEI
jgi:hypothetical protein